MSYLNHNNLFVGSHYALIRNNPEYRLMCQMEDMRLELEPAWAQPEEVRHAHANLELRERILSLEEAVKQYTTSKKEHSGRRNDVKPF